MDLEDIPGAGAFASAGVVLVDLISSGGETVVVLLIAALETIDLWVPLLSALDKWAAETGAIPQELTSQLLTGAITLLVIYYVARILRSFWQSFKENNNDT